MSAPMLGRDFSFPDAEAKLLTNYACLSVIQREIPIALPPKFIGNEVEYIKFILNAKLGKFDERLQCIPVSIKETKRIGHTGIISGENPNIYFKVLAEFIAFQPVIGSKLSARVEKLSPSHIGLLVHEWFNASVPRDAETKSVGDVGVGDEVLIEVVRSVVNRRMLSLECKLVKILNKAKVEVNGNTVGTGVHKSFDSDEETPNLAVGKKKKKRKRSGCSDSGIDHESNLDTSLSTEMLEKASKKKQKRRKIEDNDTDGAELENIIPTTDPVTDSATDLATDPVTNSVTDPVSNSVTDPVTNSVTDPVSEPVTDPVIDESGPASPLTQPQLSGEADESLLVSPKRKKKKKNRNKDRDCDQDTSVISDTNVSVDISEKKKKKSRKSVVEIETGSANESTALELTLSASECTSPKKKHKKKRKSTIE